MKPPRFEPGRLHIESHWDAIYRVPTRLAACYLILMTGIFDTVQRSLGLATSNWTIEIASVGQRTTHRPQRIHFSSSMIMSAPPLQLSAPWCIISPLTTRERPSMLMQSYGQISTQPEQRIQIEGSIIMFNWHCRHRRA